MERTLPVQNTTLDMSSGQMALIARSICFCSLVVMAWLVLLYKAHCLRRY
jgi:hypothetical protein